MTTDTNTDTMTGAEFHSAREYLGLEVRWLAAHLGVTVRQVNRWQNGKSPVPPHADRLMTDLLHYTGACMAVAAATWPRSEPLRTYTDSDLPDGDALGPWRLSASWHRILCRRIADHTGSAITYAVHPPEFDPLVLPQKSS